MALQISAFSTRRTPCQKGLSLTTPKSSRPQAAAALIGIAPAEPVLSPTWLASTPERQAGPMRQHRPSLLIPTLQPVRTIGMWQICLTVPPVPTKVTPRTWISTG